LALSLVSGGSVASPFALALCLATAWQFLFFLTSCCTISIKSYKISPAIFKASFLLRFLLFLFKLALKNGRRLYFFSPFNIGRMALPLL
jgi:hypothetical protein